MEWYGQTFEVVLKRWSSWVGKMDEVGSSRLTVEGEGIVRFGADIAKIVGDDAEYIYSTAY